MRNRPRKLSSNSNNNGNSDSAQITHTHTHTGGQARACARNSCKFICGFHVRQQIGATVSLVTLFINYSARKMDIKRDAMRNEPLNSFNRILLWNTTQFNYNTFYCTQNNCDSDARNGAQKSERARSRRDGPQKQFDSHQNNRPIALFALESKQLDNLHLAGCRMPPAAGEMANNVHCVF